MTIEPSNTNPITIGTLIHENIALKQQQQRLDVNLQVTRGQLLGCRGAKQVLQEQVETHEKTIGILNSQLNGSREANQILSNKNKELEKLLKKEKEAYIRLKGLRHAANYDMGAQQTATEVSEMQTLRNAYALVQSVKDELWNQLNAERAAHNKLKALCNERGFGTPLFYTPPALQTHKWVVCFYRDSLEIGTITYSHSPTTSKLNAIQESLNATSWKVTYSHD